ncbi:ISKra4 family transposase [Candidatus Venteria ishoeyi]|uniref:ISKra4 family transposase n=1 Tax=Candidatus Venteria ishoeyi TaxID=1899563 RepID=UPI0025A5F5CA|nr:ISKra4 family transposase [Candidatus Venteria ishoeyi]MDM8547563.1 ISKra4 family transposase [Candidatus Venteria ishoeyi]
MAKIVARKGNKLTMQVTVELTGSLMDMEDIILDACNDMGCLATEEALQKFDADGSPIMVGNTKMTSKGKNSQTYQTPYGSVLLKRYTYQTSKGGEIYCPLEEKARIIRGATPKFAKQISHKYSNMNAPAVRNDLMENHHRTVAHSYLQDVSEYVGTIAQAKEEVWEYDIPELDEAVSSIAVSLDGAHILMREEGYREAMVGNISLYGVAGERLHTVYIGEAPEYGKGTFFQRLENEIAKTKRQYPSALYLGIADGAKNNWPFLEKHTDRQLLDFFHVTEYLAKVAYAAYPGKTDKPKRKIWLHEHCTQLKHESDSAEKIIVEMEKLSKKRSLTKKIKEDLSAALTYFKNHSHMMDYAAQLVQNLPIGSGVTEAACKTLVKQRLCCSGMRWKNTGAKIILSLRALVQSKGRWKQFWERINQYGARICLNATS